MRFPFSPHSANVVKDPMGSIPGHLSRKSYPLKGQIARWQPPLCRKKESVISIREIFIQDSLLFTVLNFSFPIKMLPYIP